MHAAHKNSRFQEYAGELRPRLSREPETLGLFNHQG
jgi:hypothetical protein